MSPKSSSKPPRFLLSSNGQWIYCTVCKREAEKKGLQPKPLSYPAILIPTRPTYELIKDDGRGNELGHWRWNQLPHCRKCAIRVLKKLSERDFEPLEG